MLNINIICVGKLKEQFFKSAIDEYSKRLSKYCKLNITELPDEKIPDKIMRIFTYISKISLALFFMHIIVQKLLMLYMPKFDISNSIKTLILFVVSFGISVLIIFIGSKIKIIKNKLFLIKD